MKRISILLFCVMLSTALHAQKEQTFYKHEIGVSYGILPSAGIFATDELYGYLDFINPFLPYSKLGEINENHILTYNFGSFNFAYQYHITKMHSIGIGFLWLPRYAEFIYNPSPRMRVPIQDKGWYHHTSLTVNYRITFYRTAKIALYAALHTGLTLTFKPKHFDYKAWDRVSFFKTVGVIYLQVHWACQLDLLGIEVGTTHCFHADLGFGTQGINKMGYRYKFNSLKK
jgi:hypothetical protein